MTPRHTTYLGFLAPRRLGGFSPWEALPGDEWQTERDVGVSPHAPCSGQRLGPPGWQPHLGEVVLRSPALPSPQPSVIPFLPFAGQPLESEGLAAVVGLHCLNVPLDSLNRCPIHQTWTLSSAGPD